MGGPGSGPHPASIKANAARGKGSAEAHDVAANAHREAAKIVIDKTAIEHHEKMAETHSQKADMIRANEDQQTAHRQLRGEGKRIMEGARKPMSKEK